MRNTRGSLALFPAIVSGIRGVRRGRAGFPVGRGAHAALLAAPRGPARFCLLSGRSLALRYVLALQQNRWCTDVHGLFYSLDLL